MQGSFWHNFPFIDSCYSGHFDTSFRSVGTQSSRQEVRYQKAGNEMSNLCKVYVKSMSNFFDINFTIQPRLTFPTTSAEGSVPAKVRQFPPKGLSPRKFLPENNRKPSFVRATEYEFIAGEHKASTRRKVGSGIGIIKNILEIFSIEPSIGRD